MAHIESLQPTGMNTESANGTAPSTNAGDCIHASICMSHWSIKSYKAPQITVSHNHHVCKWVHYFTTSYPYTQVAFTAASMLVTPTVPMLVLICSVVVVVAIVAYCCVWRIPLQIVPIYAGSDLQFVLVVFFLPPNDANT